MGKKTVALIAGGVSGEREISLQGADCVEAALNKDRFRVKRYDTATDLVKLVNEAKDIDVAFVLLHGIKGEDGTIQGMLEMLNIPYQGSGVLGSALAMDKNLAKSIYRNYQLPIANWLMAEKKHASDPTEILSTLGLPVFVKPIKQGSSVGMSRVNKADDLAAAITKAFEYDDRVMVEEFIEGTEITVPVLGNDKLEALPVIEIVPQYAEFFNFEAKYKPGATLEVCPARISETLTKKAQEYGLIAHKALQLRGYSRTDMIIKEGEIYLLETNTIPGMTNNSLFPKSAATAGMNLGDLVERLINLALEPKN